jgi:hypothetical protein
LGDKPQKWLKIVIFTKNAQKWQKSCFLLKIAKIGQKAPKYEKHMKKGQNKGCIFITNLRITQ